MYIAASFTVAALFALWPAPGPEGPVHVAQALPKPSDPAKQANCSKAIGHALQEVRRPVAAREKARRDEVEARMVALIAENRRKGIDECITWTEVMKIAFGQ